MMKLKKNISLKKGKKKKANSGELPEPGLISKTQSLWNHRPRFDQETQFLTNLISNDGIEKKYQFKKFIKANKNSNKKNRNQI
jgi:hypothetical protein